MKSILAFSLVGLLSTAIPPGAFFDTSGTPKTLWSVSKGRPLVVVVTKGYWCPACMAQLAILESTKIRKLGAVVVGLNQDHPQLNQEVKEQLEIDFSILSDPEGKWLRQRKLWDEEREHPIPALLFFDHCGDLVYERKGRTPGEPDDELIFEVIKRIQKTKRDCPNFT